MPFSRGSSRPRDRTLVSCIAGRFFTVWATREARQRLKAAIKHERKINTTSTRSSFQNKVVFLVIFYCMKITDTMPWCLGDGIFQSRWFLKFSADNVGITLSLKYTPLKAIWTELHIVPYWNSIFKFKGSFQSSEYACLGKWSGGFSWPGGGAPVGTLYN